MTTNETVEARCAVSGCIANPQITKPIALCSPHVLHVIAAAMPQVIQAAATSMTGDRLDVRMLPADTDNLIESKAHDQVVYFISNGDRIKIGTTRNLRGRVSSLSLRPENVLLTVYGGVEVERELHAQFHALRVGNTEWFHSHPSLTDFIEAKATHRVVERQIKNVGVRAAGVADPRREVVFDLVIEAGADGIGPEGIVRRFRERYPDVPPPHITVIGRWLISDPRIRKPGYGRYAASP